jgi:hypothetical protein
MGLERSKIQSAPQENGRDVYPLVLAKSILATVVLVGLVSAAAFYTSGSSLFGLHSGDNVSESDRRARAEAFNSREFLQMSQVTEKDIPAAIETMHLAPADQLKMRAIIGQTAAASTAASSQSDSSSFGKQSGNPEPHALPLGANHTVAVANTQLPALAQPHKQPDLTLVWVRLWDTDVEDGDVVRIDSAGYARTVTLTSRGITFAVPVSAVGTIRITGVRDGDGGGITVGLASGSTQAILPIMSVGQALTLNVRIN